MSIREKNMYFQDRFQYNAFGLNIHSDIELPELTPFENIQHDITICLGDVPDFLENPTKKGARFHISHDSFLLKKDNVAKYLALNGNKIVIEKAPGAEDEDIRLFLLTSVLGALLHQRGLFPLHASAVKVGNECVVFCGKSGAGKSTIANGFFKRGYDLHTDDISVTKINKKGIPLVFPGYPQLKLWEDVLVKFEKDIANFNRVRPVLNKYFFPVGKSFSTTPLKLKKIYILVPWNKKDFEFINVTGAEKFSILKKQTYRSNFTDGLGKAPDQFKLASAIGKQTPVSIVRRPRKPFLLNELVDFIEKDFQ